MTTVNQLNKFLEFLYPLTDQESWDSSGCFFAPKKSTQVKGVVVCLDINKDVVKFAISHGCDVIVSHHPIFFKDSKQTKREKKLIKTIKKNKITVICYHTNFDKNKNGMNVILAKKMGLKVFKPLLKNDFSILIADVAATTTAKFCSLMNKRFPFNRFYYSKQFANKRINKICITAGSGFSLFRANLKKLEKQADGYVTGDLKWHDWQFAKSHHVNVIDSGHDIENIFIDHFYSIIKNKFKKIRIAKMYNFSDLEMA